jgi:tRNA nucleotidyltransferase (CCA-adding enzyme)
MEPNLPPELADALQDEALACEGVDGVYLVGGTVRDMLLGRPNFDVDVAVVGNAIEFAQGLTRRLGGRCQTHGQFGTAVVRYGDGEHVDVVTARRETYAAPAALPTVEPAGIREDLFRRDFTINAMAASLEGDDYGRVTDPFGGYDDLEEGTIRVLHDQSFVDDPTRIFRAIRYESRFGFRMDEHTESLARAAIAGKYIPRLSAARLRDELVELLDEREAEASIVRLGELGLAAAVHPQLRADEETAHLFARLRELDAEYELDVPDWRLGLTTLARDLERDDVHALLHRLSIPKRDARHIAAAVVDGPGIVEQLQDGGLTASEIVGLAEPDHPDAPLLALALADLEPLREYFDRLQHVQLDIGGAELAELGLGESPRVGEILAELRRRKLNGELDGRESELAAARELIEAP